jgi:hypothetical protein
LLPVIFPGSIYRRSSRIRLLAERQMGHFLREMPKLAGARSIGLDRDEAAPPSYAELGLTWDQAARARNSPLFRRMFFAKQSPRPLLGSVASLTANLVVPGVRIADNHASIAWRLQDRERGRPHTEARGSSQSWTMSLTLRSLAWSLAAAELVRGKYLKGKAPENEDSEHVSVGVTGITIDTFASSWPLEARLFLLKLESDEKAESWIGRLEKSSLFALGVIFGAVLTVMGNFVT